MNIAEKSANIILLKDVGTNNVTLLDKFLLNAEKQDITFLLELEPERFLYNWYRTSDILPTKLGYEDSWERTHDKNFRGHMFGHYMSALSQAYISAQDDSLKAQLLDKIKACVNGIVKCQTSYATKFPDRIGFAAPFSEYWLNTLDGVDTGKEEWNKKEEDNSATYVPWYNLHKVIAGLIDVYKYVKDDKIGSIALESVQRFVDYIYNCRVSKYNPTQKANMLKIEYGGIAEALYELYNLTGKPSYKECADGFIEMELFKDLADNKDVLSGKHANTTIPKLIGSIKKYTVLSQNQDYYNALTQTEKDELSMYRTSAENFFDITLAGHSFVTGGNSVAEHFRNANTISSYYNHAETHETCNEHNMLKLARELFKLTGDKKYSDYYEKTLINSILASQNPTNGEMTYFQPMGSGYSKVFNKERFWCCTGTGIESFTKLGDSIYFKNNADIYVNLYFSSSLQYIERNLVLSQKANLHNPDKITLTVASVDGGEISNATTLHLRVPNWCVGEPILTINNKKLSSPTILDGYIIIENIAKNDVIELEFMMEVAVNPLKDNANILAFSYGPFVLAMCLGQNNVGQNADTGIMVLRAVADLSLPTSIILTTDNVDEWKKNIKTNLVRINNTDDGIIQFKLNETQLDESVVIMPYYAIYNHRYGLYMHIDSVDSAEMTAKILSDKQTLRNDESASSSLMQIDGNNYEATYNIQKSENSSIGAYNGRNYRDAQKDGWFSYDMPIVENTQNYLNTVYTQADNNRSFKILINGEDFITEIITNSKSADVNGFYTETRKIPLKYTKGADIRYTEISGVRTPCVNIKFQSIGDLVGGLYGISVTHELDTNASLDNLSFDIGTLSPKFNAKIKEYTLALPINTQNISMKATPIKKSGLVYVDDILIDDTQNRIIKLSPQNMVQKIVTYAQDHISKTEYVINIVFEN